MEEIKSYLKELKQFKNKQEIVSEVESLFEVSLTDYKFKKIIDELIELTEINSIVYKNKFFYISQKILDEKQIPIEELFNELYLLNNVSNTTNTIKMDLNTYIKSDAIMVKSLNDIFIKKEM